MSRAHVRGYDTNAAQFERMGDPWVTRREQQELGNSPVSRGETRRNRAVRPCERTYPEPRPVHRPLTPEEQQRAAWRDELRLLRNMDKQARGKPVREETGWRPAPQIINVHRAARDTELTGWQRFERQVTRCKQRAEVAARCERAERISERERLEAVIAAAQARLADLAD